MSTKKWGSRVLERGINHIRNTRKEARRNGLWKTHERPGG
jgi:hypothetical protein